MICLDFTASGFVPTSPQPTDYTTCSYVLQSGSELHASVLNITAAEGLQLSAAIVAVWTIGFVARMGIKATNIDEKEN
jgi:hypothetical protein